MDHPYLSFLDGHGPDHRGRTLDEILAWPDDRLEATHDFIQWLFPIPSGPGVNPYAPTLTPDLTSAVREDPARRARVRQALARMLAFYGYRLDSDEISSHDGQRTAWLRPHDHNHLRITRILTHLEEVGLSPLATAFRARLAELPPVSVTPDTRRYWGLDDRRK